MSAPDRNAPCPCGSGRKAKNCCLRPEVPAGRRPTVDIPAFAGHPPRTMSIADATALAQRHHAQNDFQNAGALFQLILNADPECDDALFYFGIVLHQVGRSDEGVAMMRKALARNPGNFAYHDNMGRVMDDLHRHGESVAAFRRALQLRPSADAHYNLGVALMHEDALEESAECFRQAIRLRPALQQAIMAHTNLGTVLQRQGRLQEAIESTRRALSLSNDTTLFHGNYLYMLNFLPNPDRAMIFQEHRRIGAMYEAAARRSNASDAAPRAAASAPAAPHASAPRVDDSPRPLRVGYLSPDFREHAVAHFIEPVLAAHDRAAFELFCYSHHTAVDAVTRRLQSLVPNWRSIVGMSDDDAARMIRDDRIDILVDLAGHTGLGRLPVFARRPAPVQATWLGYPNTTGLTTMDWRITDAHADPPGMTEPFHTESLMRLPDCFSCFRPPQSSPAVGPLPALAAGHVTFGSFNLITKMTPEVMAVWARLLRRVPGSTLTLKYYGLDAPAMRAMIHRRFADHGVPAERVTILGKDAAQADHLNRYNAIDIALDPFPYNGTTTSLDALWMGVPVVTLAGSSHVSRVGVSQLSNLGLSELIARDEDDYVEIAARLAGDLPRLAALRSGLRERMQASPLTDAARFTRNLEDAYRAMWNARQSPGAERAAP
jgi:predicted O-linked N-acetylglucosamine transferase (SPINDLY family)